MSSRWSCSWNHKAAVQRLWDVEKHLEEELGEILDGCSHCFCAWHGMMEDGKALKTNSPWLEQHKLLKALHPNPRAGQRFC